MKQSYPLVRDSHSCNSDSMAMGHYIIHCKWLQCCPKPIAKFEWYRWYGWSFFLHFPDSSCFFSFNPQSSPQCKYTLIILPTFVLLIHGPSMYHTMLYSSGHCRLIFSRSKKLKMSYWFMELVPKIGKTSLHFLTNSSHKETSFVPPTKYDTYLQ